MQESWTLRSAGRLREAELKLYEAMTLQPDDSYLAANLADVCLRQGRHSEARSLSLQALEKQPRQALALTVLGQVALLEHDFAEAVANLEQACAIGFRPFRAGLLARAYEESEKPEKALQVLQEALKKYPDDVYLHRQRNRLQQERAAAEPPAGPGLPWKEPGDGPGEDKTDGAQSGTLPSPGPGHEAGPAYAEKLREQLSGLEPARAAAQLEKIIRVGKRRHNPALQSLLGELLRQAGDDEKAAQAYRRAREIDPGQLFALSQEAFCLRRLGQKETAWPLLKILLERDPRNQPVRASFLRDAEDLDRLQEAIDFLVDLLNRQPHHKAIHGMIKKLEARRQAEEP